MTGTILVFDSGIGGLSVLSEIRQQLPQWHYHYLFDNARLPYGNLGEQELIDGCVHLISKQVEHIKADMVVVACNTASTLVLPALRRTLSIPVVGVVPAIKPAAALSTKKRIGLLATPGTVKRDYTQELIQQFAIDCHVELFGSAELVMMAEQYIADGQLDHQALAQVLAPISKADIDVLVLGCTHFPMIAAQITNVLGPSIKLVDSGKAIANRVKSLLWQPEENMADHGQSAQLTQMLVSYTKSIGKGLTEALKHYGFSDFALIDSNKKGE